MTRCLVASLALSLIISGVAAAQTSVPITINISGTVAPSEGQEGDITGIFTINGEGVGIERKKGLSGEFTGRASLDADGPGLGPVGKVTIYGSINGRFAIQGNLAMISFSGVSSDGQVFSGQLRGDLVTRVFIGFFNIPGNGFMTVIFVQGYGTI